MELLTYLVHAICWSYFGDLGWWKFWSMFGALNYLFLVVKNLQMKYICLRHYIAHWELPNGVNDTSIRVCMKWCFLHVDLCIWLPWYWVDATSTHIIHTCRASYVPTFKKILEGQKPYLLLGVEVWKGYNLTLDGYWDIINIGQVGRKGVLFLSHWLIVHSWAK